MRTLTRVPVYPGVHACTVCLNMRTLTRVPVSPGVHACMGCIMKTVFVVCNYDKSALVG